jgi:hypothetical protein
MLSSRKVSSRHGVSTTVVCRSAIFVAVSWSCALAPDVHGAMVAGPVSRSGR